MSDPETYYCTECKHSHKYSSKIGKAHLDYADVEPEKVAELFILEPAEITVKPAADSNKTEAEAHVSQPPGDTVKPQPKGELSSESVDKNPMHGYSDPGVPPGSGGPTEQEIERWITEDPKFATLMAVNLELSNKLKEVIDHQSRAQYIQPQHMQTASAPVSGFAGSAQQFFNDGGFEKLYELGKSLLGGEKKEDETTSLVRMVVDEINLREETSKRVRARAIAGYITGDYEIDVKVPEDKK